MTDLRKVIYDALDLSDELRNECTDAVVAALAPLPEAPAVPVGPCKSCDGRGTQPDYVGDDMHCVETGCDACNGTGRSALVATPPAPTAAVDGEVVKALRTARNSILSGFGTATAISAIDAALSKAHLSPGTDEEEKR